MIEREDDLRREVENKDEVDQSVKDGSVKEFELSMMEKTCAEYKRKIEEYRRYSEEMRS